MNRQAHISHFCVCGQIIQGHMTWRHLLATPVYIGPPQTRREPTTGSKRSGGESERVSREMRGVVCSECKNTTNQTITRDQKHMLSSLRCHTCHLCVCGRVLGCVRDVASRRKAPKYRLARCSRTLIGRLNVNGGSAPGRSAAGSPGGRRAQGPPQGLSVGVESPHV